MQRTALLAATGISKFLLVLRLSWSKDQLHKFAKLWLVGVATDRDARHACLRFISLFLFLFSLAFLSILFQFLFDSTINLKNIIIKMNF